MDVLPTLRSGTYLRATAAWPLGLPDGSIVSLGDSGIAIATFAHPIYNGSGPDFAVFENGFQKPC
jgi:hypothetical protein